MSADTDRAAGEVLVQGSTVYVLNERGVNRWVAQVQAGRDENDERTSDAECHAIAQRIAAALSTPPAVVPAAPSSYINGAHIRASDMPGEVVRKLDAAYHARIAAVVPTVPSDAVTDAQIDDWIATLADYDIAGSKLFGRDRIHRFARAILALSQTTQPQAETVPKGWRIEREPRNVLALHRTGTAQPYRFEPGEAVHALLSDLLGGCPECGGSMEYEDGEAWDGPSVGCTECGLVATPPAATPAAPSEAATLNKKDLNKLLNDFARACAFGDDVLARMAASKAIHEYLDAAFAALAQPAPVAAPAPASEAIAEGKAFDAFLCRAWGETDLPIAELVTDWEGVRRFMVREWLGEEDEEVLLQVKDDFAQHEEDMGANGGPFFLTFEIGGVSVERVCGFAAPPQAGAGKDGAQ